MTLTYENTLTMGEELAPLITPDEDEPKAVRFDALMYGIELAFLAGKTYSKGRSDLYKKVKAVASVANIPEIMAQADFLNKLIHTDYIESAGINEFEEIRKNLRDLIKYIPVIKWSVTIDAIDTILSQEYNTAELDNDDLKNYKMKAEYYVRQNQDQTAIKKLRTNLPLTKADIASLEKELDVRLFIRNTKEVNLSEDGKTLYKYARQMIDLEEQIEACFVGEKQQEGRKISIAASTIPAQYILPRILSKFNEKYPREQFKVVESDSAKVVELVAGGAADIGFTGTVLEKKFCKYVPFYKDELIIIMPNTEKYEKRVNEQNLNWITEEAFIMREEGSGTRKEAEKQLKKAGIDTEQLNIVASMGNQEAIKRSVISGMGITIISKLAAEEEIRTGKVLWCPMPDKSDGRDLNIVYNKNFHLSKSAERFIRVTKEMYGIDKK